MKCDLNLSCMAQGQITRCIQMLLHRAQGHGVSGF